MSVDIFLILLVGASIVTVVLIIRKSKASGTKTTPWLDETRGVGIVDDGDADD